MLSAVKKLILMSVLIFLAVFCFRAGNAFAISWTPNFSSSTHTPSESSTNTSVTVSWSVMTPTEGTTADSYVYVWDNTNNTEISASKTRDEYYSGVVSTLTVTRTLADGTWYLHARAVDMGGFNWTPTRHFGPVIIDTTPAPTVTKIEPDNGLNSSDTVNVTITGQYFKKLDNSEFTSVTARIGTTALSNISVVSSTSLTATYAIKDKTVGAKNVTVTTGWGTSEAITGGFTVKSPAPTVTAISPTSASNAAEKPVTITGTGFLSGASVQLRDPDGANSNIDLPGVTVVSKTSITATVPTGKTVDTYNVVVTNTDSQSGTLTDGFEIKLPAPTISSVSPSSGTNEKTTTITITGTNFATSDGIPQVTLEAAGKDTIACLSEAVTDAATMTAVVPTDKTTGTYDVKVTNPDSQYATVSEIFTVSYPVPTITSISPASMTNDDTQSVTITGTNFCSGATVKIGTTSCTGITLDGTTPSTKLTCTVPASITLGIYDVKVTNTGTDPGTLSSGFTVNSATTTAGLTYSASDTSSVPAGDLTITAIFTQSQSAAPKISIDQHGTTDITETDMTASGDDKIWTYTYTVHADNDGTYDDGAATVTIKTSGGTAVSITSGSTFTIDTASLSATITYAQGDNTSGPFKTDTLTITATLSAEEGSAPKISINQQGSTDITDAIMTGSGTSWTYDYTVTAKDGTAYKDGTTTVTLKTSVDATISIGSGGIFTIDTTPPTVALTYAQGSNTSGPFKADVLTITATFSETPKSTPLIAIAQTGGTNISAADMTATDSGRVWTYPYTIHAATEAGYADGEATVIISNGGDAASNPNAEATNNTFTIDTVGPTTSNVLAGGNTNLQVQEGTTASITLTAVISDAATGGRNIRAAEYFVGTAGDDGFGTAMSAVDGAFDSAAEAVTATVNTSSWTAANSPYTLLVHGQDTDNSWGATQSVQVNVYIPVAVPGFAIGTGTYNSQQAVMVTLAGDSANTYYTLDGSEPDNTDMLYISGSKIAIDGNDGAVITLKMVSYDAAGNKGTEGTAIYTFDKVAPTVAITDPAAGKYVTIASYNIKGTENDGTGSGVTKVEVSIDNGVTWKDVSITSPWAYDAMLAQGANIIKVRATDNVGNVSDVITCPTLTYYPVLTIKVDGQNVTDGEIYVPNLVGNNTKTIVVEGGSANYAAYTCNFSPALSVGTLSAGTADNEKVFTANVGAVGNENLTIQDPADTSLYSAALTIHVVSFGVLGNAGIVKGEQSLYTVVGANGDITWEITTGQDVSGIPVVAGTKNINATVTPSITGTFKIKAIDGITGAFEEKTVEVVDPIVVTPNKLSVDDEESSTLQFNVIGGKGEGINANYTWSVDSGGIINADGLFTPAAGDGVRTFKATATDEIYANISGQSETVTIVNPIAVTNLPAGGTMQSGTTHDSFEFAGGTGTVNWSSDAGSIDINGKFIAPTVTTGFQDVTITATDNNFANIVATNVVSVYPTLVISNAPAETPTVEAGQTYGTVLQASGAVGSGNYQWMVTTDPSETFGDWTTTDAFTFIAPDTGAFAGGYEITLRDKTNPAFTTTFQVKVPIKLTPASKAFTETKLDDNRSSNPQTLTISGADGECYYAWEILDSKTATSEVNTSPDYGNADEISLIPTDVPVKKFYIRITVENDTGLTEDNGLNKRVFGPFNIIPVDIFTVTVSDLDGNPIGDPNANVSVDYIDPNTLTQIVAQDTNIDGEAVFTLPDAGGTYFYTITATDKVSQEISSNSKEVSIKLEAIGDTITGTVEDTGNTAKNGATVTAYQPSDITTKYQATTAEDGTYTINLPVGAAQSGWTVVAGLADFVAVSRADQAVGAVNFTGTYRTGYGLQAKTTIETVSATVVDTTLRLDITAIPAFTAVSEASVALIEGNGVLGVASFAGGTVSVTYNTVEDFTVIIKADTSENNDPALDTGAGYLASRAFSYLVADTATKSEQLDVKAGGSGTKTVTTPSQTATVEVPVGGLTKAATIVIKQVPKTKTATSTQASHTYVYEVTATDITSGSELASGDIIRIEITLPIDLSVINQGDLENDIFIIYHADSLATLEAGGGVAVSSNDIISSDYIGDGSIGSVTFYVSSLSVFGIGSSSSSSGSGGGGGSGGTSLSDTSDDDRCFIATSAYGSPFESHVKILRNFRDVYLLSNRIGHAFVDTYYKYSPKAAAFIADHEFLRAVVRVGLMPVVGISYAALHTTAAQKTLIIFLMFSLLTGICLAVRRLKVRKIVTV